MKVNDVNGVNGDYCHKTIWGYIVSAWLTIYRPIENVIFRCVRGYTTPDLWSLDYSIIAYMKKTITAFRKSTRHGYPMMAKSVDDWNAILDDMLYFLNNYDDWKLPIASGKMDFPTPTDGGIFDKKATDSLKEEYEKEPPIDYARYIRGRRLLIVYFSALWD